MKESRDKEIQIGFVLSAVGHAFVALLFLRGYLFTPADFGAATIYSVTLEGGEKLGGIAQVPDEKKKSQIAPPKKVESKPEPQVKEETKKAPQEVPPKEKEPKKEEVKKEEKAEVSIAEDKKKIEPKKEPEKNPKDKDKEEKNKEKKPEPPKKVEKKQPQQTGTDVNKKLQEAMQRYLGESTDAGGSGFGAGSLGAKGMGGGVVMPESFHRYRKLLHDKIKGGWRWFDTSARLMAEATFEISRTGDITNVKISKSSGSYEFDDSVERAILKATPLPPPPPEVYTHFRLVRMIFDPQDL